MPHADPERSRIYMQEYHARKYRQDREAVLARNKAWREANREKVAAQQRAYRFRRRYGITVEKYDALLAEQGGGCAICHEVPKKVLRVDHDHGTGEVRGLLCHQCNVGLGFFKDDPERLRSAVEYLGVYTS